MMRGRRQQGRSGAGNERRSALQNYVRSHWVWLFRGAAVLIAVALIARRTLGG